MATEVTLGERNTPTQKSLSISKPISRKGASLNPTLLFSPPPATGVPAGLQRHGLEPRHEHQLEAPVRSAAAARVIRETFKDDARGNFFQTKGEKKTVCFCVAAQFSVKRIAAQSAGQRGDFSKAAQQRVTSLLLILYAPEGGRRLVGARRNSARLLCAKTVLSQENLTFLPQMQLRSDECFWQRLYT